MATETEKTSSFFNVAGGEKETSKPEETQPKNDNNENTEVEDVILDNKEDNTKQKENKTKESKESKEDDNNDNEEELDTARILSQVVEEIKDEIGDFEIPKELLEGEFTVEALAKFSKAIAGKAKEAEIEAFAAEFPDAINLALYIRNGGTVNEFLENYKGTDYSKIELNRDNPEQLKKIIEAGLAESGLSKRKIDKFIADAEDEDKLYEEAEEELTKLISKKEEENKRLLEKQRLEKEKIEKEMTSFKSEIKEVITEGQIGKFKIEDKREFSKFVSDSLQTDGKGNFYMVKPINSKNLNKVLQSLYFDFKDGDLSKFVEVNAKTALAQKIKLGQNKSKGSGSNKEDNSNLPNSFFQVLKGEK